MMRCPQCEATFEERRQYCPFDGTELIDDGSDSLAASSELSLPASAFANQNDSRKQKTIAFLGCLGVAILGLLIFLVALVILQSPEPSSNNSYSNLNKPPNNTNTPPVNFRTPAPSPSFTALPTPSASASPAPIKSPTPSIDEIRDKLFNGSMAFNKPDKVTLDTPVNINLVLSPTVSKEELIERVQGEGERKAVSLRVGEYMEATLYGENFTILNGTQRKLVSQKEVTQWNWDVTPTKPGKQRLHLVLNALVNYADGEKPLEIKTFQEFIEVEVTFAQRATIIGAAISGHLQWIAPGIVIPLALWLWNRRRKGEPASDPQEEADNGGKENTDISATKGRRSRKGSSTKLE